MSQKIHPPLKPLHGRKFQIVVEGRNSPNGQRRAQVLQGTMALAGEDPTIYEAAYELLSHAEEQAQLAYPEAIRLTIFPHQPEEAAKA